MMEMCRVCLTTEKETFSLDDSFVSNYNLLTNLNITLFDGMPQYSCQTCSDTVKYFIEFREKSIASETTLRQIYSDLKIENKTDIIEKLSYEEQNLLAIKSLIKEEHDDSIFESFDNTFDEYNEDIKLKSEDIKTIKTDEDIKIVKRHKKKKIKLRTGTLLEDLTNEIEDSWFCGICPKTFENPIELNNHLDIHKNDRECKLCREQVNSLSQLLGHRLMHVPLKQSKCHICEKRYKSCVYLEHHYRNTHIEGDGTKLCCSRCPITCDTPKKLNSHMLQVHSTIKYICDVCSKGFQSKSCLKSHIKSHSENRAYVCDLCDFSCKHSGGLKDHKIRKHAPKKVYCKNCKRPFVNQEEHDTHTCAKKLIVCPVCGLQLNGNSRLSRHMVSHSNIARYECKKCPSKYKTKSALISHMNRHDGNRTKQCEFCPAKFYTAPVLIKHRRIHTGEKPYVCKVCNKGFTGNHNLKVHMKVHGENLVVKKQISEHEDVSNNFRVVKFY